MGVALWFAQNGRLHPTAVPLRGGRFAGVVEVRTDLRGSTYRLMYSAKWGETIYVLAAFQKKSTRGITTPRHVLDLIEARWRQARVIHQQHGSRP